MAERPVANTIERYLAWLAAQSLVVGAVAGVAFLIQQENIAPAVLFPLAVGAVLAAGGLFIVGTLAVPGRRVALATAVVSGLLVVVGQDYIGHRYRLRLYADEIARHDAMAVHAVARDTAEPRFTAFLASKIRSQLLWWSIDVVLTSGAALAVTAWGLRGNRNPSLTA